MGITRRAPAAIGTILLGAVVVSGCAGSLTVPDRAPLPPGSTQPAPAKPQLSPLLAEQKRTIERYVPNAGTVLQQYAGIGPATIGFGPLPAGQKSVGISVRCDGPGHWEARLADQKLAVGNGLCSADGVLSLAFPLEEPGRDHSFIVAVPDGAHVWATVFSTK